MTNGEEKLFDTYKDKSNSLQRLIIIFLGVAFFFFFMILIPYLSLKADTYKLYNIYGLLNKTLDDIKVAAGALSILYYENMEQNRNLTEGIDMYGKQLQNQSINDNDLRKITYRSCDIHIKRSQPWIKCNSDIRIEELRGQLNATVKLDNTALGRIKEAINNQIKLTQESQGFLDINKIVSIKTVLENLTSREPVRQLYGLQPSIINLTQAVNKQISILLTQTNALSEKFKSLDTPLGGNIPVGFNELLAVFPLAMSIVFCYVALMLRDTIRLRRVLVEKSNVPVKDYISKSPLWVDPKLSDNTDKEGRILHSVLAWIVLAIPAVLFIGSVIMIYFIWSWVTVVDNKFPAFVAAEEFNKLVYGMLYGIGAIVLVLSYALIIKEVRKN